MKYLLKIFILSALLLALISTPVHSLTTIELKENVCLSGEEIFLKDIANMSTTFLNEVYIGKMPLPGRKRCITQDYVKLRILQAKIKEEDFKLTGSNKVTITAFSQKLDMEEVTKRAKSYLLDMISGNQRVEIEPLGTPKDIILPQGKIEYEMSLINNPNLRNNVYISVDIKLDSKKYQTIRLGFKIRRFANVVVTTKPLTRYHILTPLDIKIVEREVSYLNPVPLDEVMGKRLKIALEDGRILTYDLIEIPPLIKRGDVVTIKREDEFLIIGAKGIAREDGRLGDKIRVENTTSKKIITGIVEDDKTVVVK